MKKLTLGTILFCLPFYALQAQEIPNKGFETWVNIPGVPAYEEPQGWISSNSITKNPEFATKQYINVTKSTDKASGAFAIKLATVVNATDTIPGYAASFSSMDHFYNSASGFPCATYPISLKGKYKYERQGQDQAFILVLLTKYFPQEGFSDEIAFGELTIDQSANAYTNFSVDMVIEDPELLPDSAIIYILSSNPDNASGMVNGSTLYIDELAFTESTGLQQSDNALNGINVYPNPATEIFHLTLTEKASARICDVSGKMVLEQELLSGEQSLDVSDINPGVYLLQLQTNKGVSSRKMVIY